MAVVNGDIRILHIKRAGGEFKRVAHLTVNSWESSLDFISTTTRYNAGYKTQRPVSQSDAIGFSAIIFDDADVVGKLGYKELREVKDNKELIEWKLEAFNRGFTDAGRGHISSLTETAPFGDVLSYESSIMVYGRPLNIVDVLPPTAPLLNPILQKSVGYDVDITWTVSTDNILVTGYELRKQEGKAVTVIDVGLVQIFTDNGLAVLQTYGYNVRSYDAAGNFSPWSNKRNIQLRPASGIPVPVYKNTQNNNTKLYQNGAPKIYQ